MKWWDVRLNFFFFSHRHPPAGCHREMNILSCQEEKVMRLVLFLSLFLSPSLPFRSWWFGSSNQEELFYCYHWKHFILLSEAPTVLCGLRASQNLKSFLLQCIILEDHYMIYYSWGEKTDSESSCCCFSYSNSRAEDGSEVLTQTSLIVCVYMITCCDIFQFIAINVLCLNRFFFALDEKKNICFFSVLILSWKIKLFAEGKQKTLLCIRSAQYTNIILNHIQFLINVVFSWF